MNGVRRIRADEARIGMFVCGFEGSWFDHPFWRKRFLITDVDQIAKLRESDCMLLIDDRLSRAPRRPMHGDQPAAERHAAYGIVGRPGPQLSQDELDRRHAREVVSRSRAEVKRLFNDMRLGIAVSPERVGPLVGDITRAVERNAQALLGICRIKTKDEYTYLHSVAVCALMINFASRLDLDKDEALRLGIAGLLHDIGKMAVPTEILQKPGKLSRDEYVAVRGHPERGHELLLQSEGLPDEALDICLHHHEKMDGTGYPFGMAADRLSLAARMGAICDVYDALTSNRPYKRGWTPSQAVGAMQTWPGHFDPDLLFRFCQSIGVFPPGMVVRLRTNRLAVVINNGRCTSRQQVQPFYDLIERCVVDPGPVMLGESLSTDQVVTPGIIEAVRIPEWDILHPKLLARARIDAAVDD